ncbi:fatty acid-binding protein [Eurytemora carolleeae]|uniref:fatty acid-binding protein n=1 Tax=Eurytemora carolleeae TaxID=1294199 RepID=UPI000C7679F7|nr:fatty acid-binding protein [Eurytemora carolleeae]|eukprot:XP_023349513.1 fatty acid-binding protein-like [Eurytemora affinis]
MKNWIAILFCVAPVLGAKQLPEAMIGEFKLESSEGFTDFMYELGVDWFKRNIACTIYPKLVIAEKDDGEISVDTISTFKNTYTKFKLGEPWEEYTADGRYTTTTTTVDLEDPESPKLIKKQVPEPSTGYKTTYEVREFIDNGETMVLTLTIEGVPDIKSTRIYKRLNANE